MLNNLNINDSISMIKDWIEKNNKAQEFKLRWFTKFENLSKEQREEIVHKIVDKYNSEKYRERELKKSYEPRCYLYDMLFEYGSYYGEPIMYMQNNHFDEEQYVIDDNILVSKIYGQGDFIYVKFLDKSHGKRWLRADFHDALQKFLSKWAEKIHGQYTIEGSFKLESHKHFHDEQNAERFTIDSFKFDLTDPKLSHD